jgi:UDP-3-O-[3-hydroxymyristoyl] glucosamine N-acyltransferase
MPDQRFFHRSGPFRLDKLAALTGSEIMQVNGAGGDPARLFHDVGPLDGADAETFSFLDNRKYRDAFKISKAGGCVIHPDMKEHAPAGMAVLLNKRPYKAYALIAQAFYPQQLPEAQIAPTAFIDTSAKLGKGVIIGPGAAIGANAEIGDGSWIEANAVIGDGVKIGRQCRIGSNTTISHSLIGDHVRIYPGNSIGQDGFGFAPDPAGHVKMPQLGRVIVGDGVEIGANCAIDRGSASDTVIGPGTWLDNLVQIGHNVKLGKGCILAGQVGIAGSTVIGDYVVMGGQAGVAGHLNIGSGAQLAAQTGVLRDVPAGQEQMGYPSLPLRQFLRQIALLNKMTSQKKNGTETDD